MVWTVKKVKLKVRLIELNLNNPSILLKYEETGMQWVFTAQSLSHVKWCLMNQIWANTGILTLAQSIIHLSRGALFHVGVTCLAYNQHQILSLRPFPIPLWFCDNFSCCQVELRIKSWISSLEIRERNQTNQNSRGRKFRVVNKNGHYTMGLGKYILSSGLVLWARVNLTLSTLPCFQWQIISNLHCVCLYIYA